MASIRTRKQTGKLYLDFYFDGARYREQTALPDTPENRTKLGKLADKPEREIAKGKFNYAEFFGKPAKEPRLKASDAYPRAGGLQRNSGVGVASQVNAPALQTPTFAEFLDIWRNENFVQFRKSYQRTVEDIFKAHLVPKFGNTRVGDIRREDLLTFRSDLAKAPGRKGLTMSPKRVNAIMALMSQIMSEASDRCAKRLLPAKATGSSRPFAVIQSIRAKRSLQNSNPIPTCPAPSTDWTGQTAS